MSGGVWGIWRSRTSVDEFGKRHTVGEWVIGEQNGGPLNYLEFGSEREARAVAGVYNSMDRWTYEARRLDA